MVLDPQGPTPPSNPASHVDALVSIRELRQSSVKLVLLHKSLYTSLKKHIAFCCSLTIWLGSRKCFRHYISTLNRFQGFSVFESQII